MNVSDTGVSLVSGNDGSWKNFYEVIETSKLIVGRTYTFSFLAEDNGGVRQCYISDYGSTFDGDKGLYTITFTAKETTQNQDFGLQTNVGKTSIPIAAKLELGDQQTLAHKEGDAWVLNEVPDYGEQLARCQRYARAYKCLLGQTFLPLGAYRSDRKAVSFVLPTSCFRASPTVSALNDTFQLFDGTNVYQITSLAVVDYSDGLVDIYAYTSQSFENGKVLWLFSNTGMLFLSADL